MNKEQAERHRRFVEYMNTGMERFALLCVATPLMKLIASSDTSPDQRRIAWGVLHDLIRTSVELGRV
jgi:hypothetical protein